MARPKSSKIIEKRMKDTFKVDVIKPHIALQEEIEYEGYMIIIEPHGRVIVTDRGLNVAEFIDIESDISLLINKAEEYIDALR